ncbi:ABC transporter ATP-binding protein [Clostridium intestinale]|uniref:ABC transporter ATP-binding protein n=1 Tax=Clostridium intestinale TaxID=36845 RepID=UPI002DD66F3B|nr:ABC transporter ATP-binding protein [Clostridium intestinale]WRY51091.1 ABC transporter ATP-binding protein [Clostridium intestinale]
MHSNSVISVQNITQKFGSNTVLDDVSIEVKKGEVLGILGPSGSGKTTLVKSIVGMQTPNLGSIEVLNTKIPSLKVTSKVGYMAQSDALYEDLNAMDNLLFFAELYGLKVKKAKERAREVLKLTHLLEDEKKAVRNFSGGMKRRLSLAIALIHAPEILILDEPTVGIDPVLRQEFWGKFNELKDSGCTIIITTHVMDEAEKCDRLALIRDGKITALSSPEDLKKQAKTETIEGAFLYFGSLKGEK